MNRRVRAAHQPPKGPPLCVRAGESLVFERRETNWEGWLWCTSDDGRTGWVPEEWTAIEGACCRLLRAYDATELPVIAGEGVTVIESVADWAIIRRADQSRGWVPLEILDE